MDSPPSTPAGPPAATTPSGAPDLFELPLSPELTEAQAAPASLERGEATSSNKEADSEDAEDAAPVRTWREDLGDVDWDVVRSLWSRELLITIRSRAWMRLLSWFTFGTLLLALLPILYRMAPYHWESPGGFRWLQFWSLGTAGLLLAAVSGWTRRGIAREMRGGVLQEIMLTGSGPADILLGKSLAAACLTSLLVMAAFPALLLSVAIGGRDPYAVPRLAITLSCCAYLGLCLGLEYSFRKPGSRSTVGRLWSLFYLVMVLGNLARWSKWSWLAAPRGFLIAYNPLSTLLSAAGGKAERWPIGIVVFLILLSFLTLISFRLLRREWAEAAARGKQRNWLLRIMRPTPPAEAREKHSPPTHDNAILAFEESFGYRVRIPKWGWIVGLVVTGLLLLIPKPEVGRFLFALYFTAASWVAAHNGCAAFAREREAGRWEELALLPLSDQEIVGGKLAAGARTWQALSIIALFSLLASAAWAHRLDPYVLFWALISLAATPWSMSRIGALLGLLTVTPDEAQWRTSLVSTMLPAVLTLGLLAGFQVHSAAALSPSFGAVSTVAPGTISTAAWYGTALYSAFGATCVWLTTSRLRRWALVTTT